MRINKAKEERDYILTHNSKYIDKDEGRIERESERKRQEERLNRQMGWMTLITMINFAKATSERLEGAKEVHMKKVINELYGGRIGRSFLRWFYRHQFQKYQLHFYKSLNNSRMSLKIGIRIHLKKMAIRKIKTFLEEYSRKQNMQLICQKFLHCTKKIQVLPY